MIRLSALFVAVCMVVIAGSFGLVLYLLFGVTGAESAVVGLAALTGLAVYNATAMRMRLQSELSGQIGDLSRGTADLARQVGEQGRRLQALEKAADNSLQKAIALTQPYQTELNELATMLRQLAQSVAVQDTTLRQLAGKTDIAAPPPEAAASASAPPQPPAAASADTAMPLPAEKPPAAAPARQLTDTIPSGPLKGLTGQAVVGAVRDAIDDNRIDIYLQPIVTLPQRKVRYYEALMRLRIDDKVIAAAEFLPWAELGGLAPSLDQLMVARCVRVLRRLQTKTRDVGVFCNLSGATLADRETMAQIVDFAEANRVLGPVLTFEVPHAVLRTAGTRENESLSRLTDLGFRLSVDHVADLRIDTRDLVSRKCAFMKIPASVLLDRSSQAASDIHPADLSGLLARNGIELIGEKIETEAMVVDLLDFDLKYGQGNLFSPPRPVKQEQPRPEAAAAKEPAAETVPAPALPQASVPAALAAAARVPAPAAPAASAENAPSDFTIPALAENERPAVISGNSALARLAKIVARN